VVKEQATREIEKKKKKIELKWCMMGHTCNSSIWEAKAGRLKVPD
jgi:hypothetical protein